MEWVPFSKRPEWADVSPVPQDDGPNPVVSIQYSAEFRESMDYFRAVLQRDERSQRALGLTTEVIRMNSANYTVWHFRRLCLEATGSDLRQELAFVQSLVEDNPKNYQIWYHRRAIVEKLGDGSKEIDFVTYALDEDSKNYHAWAHRQWALSTYNLWGEELELIDDLLEEDVRNNSAWNHRWFVVTHTEKEITKEIARREIKYAMKYIEIAPSNESAWNYMRGWYRFASNSIKDFPEIYEFCNKLASTVAPSERFVLTTQCDWHEAEGSAESLSKAKNILSILAETVDPVRRRYWTYRANQIAERAAA